jgi:hypothetical protein
VQLFIAATLSGLTSPFCEPYRWCRSTTGRRIVCRSAAFFGGSNPPRKLKNEKPAGGEACRQYDRVDVAVLGPGRCVSVLGLSPEEFDVITEWHEVQQGLEQRPGAVGLDETVLAEVLPHPLNGQHSDREVGFTKGKSAAG